MGLVYIGVVGGTNCSKETEELAFQVGYEIGKRGAILVCGGLGGVMEAACRGAKKAGGVTLGILPGIDREKANRWVDIAIPTGLSIVRNFLIVRTSDAIIALPGRFGTLSEIAIALNLKKPVVGLSTWEIEGPIIRVESPKEAVEKAFNIVQQSSREDSR